jgi:hypothetical protein
MQHRHCLVVSASLLLGGCGVGADPLVAERGVAATMNRAPAFEQAGAAPSPMAAAQDGNMDDASGGAECVTDDGAPYIAPAC